MTLDVGGWVAPARLVNRLDDLRVAVPATSRSTVRRSVVVVGDDAFRAVIEQHAPRAGRTVVGHIRPSEVGLCPAPTHRMGPPGTELVVAAAQLDEFRSRYGDLIDGLTRVRVVSDPTVSPFDHPIPRGGRWAKRAADIVLSALGLVLLLPLLIVALLAVRLETRGPVFFRQARVGANGRQFRLVKIRTMRHRSDDADHRRYFTSLVRGEAERQGGLFKLAHDPRVTRVGRVLRRFSIDEIPQFWNVLVGHMSLVGPRPLLPADLPLFDADAWQRLQVQPGITGLWQVSGRNELSFAEMIELDVRYWESWTPMLDLKILARTPKVVISGAGAA